MSDYKKLKVWEDAHEFTIDIYNITRKFPNNEQYGLTSQIRRSSSSAYETEYQLLLAKDLGYLKLEEYNLLNKKIKDIIYMLFGLIKSLKNS
jgi:hypothetical protein